jgi:hypothetical protein
MSVTAVLKLARENISGLLSVPTDGGRSHLRGDGAGRRVVSFVEERAEPPPRPQDTASRRSRRQAEYQAEHARVGLTFPGDQAQHLLIGFRQPGKRLADGAPEYDAL